jgi:hypothetical protein
MAEAQSSEQLAKDLKLKSYHQWHQIKMAKMSSRLWSVTVAQLVV